METITLKLSPDAAMIAVGTLAEYEEEKYCSEAISNLRNIKDFSKFSPRSTDVVVQTVMDFGTVDDLRYVIEHGMNVDLIYYGISPLMYAVTHYLNDKAKLLLEYAGDKVDLNKTLTSSGENVLHTAASYCNLEILNLLIDKYKMNVDAETHRGETPLMLACEYIKCNLDCIDSLIMRGADVLHRSKNGESPLMVATKSDYSLAKVKMLVKNGATVLTSDLRGTTPVMNAVTRGDYELFTYLVDHGAEVVNTPDPVHWMDERTVKGIIEKGGMDNFKRYLKSVDTRNKYNEGRFNELNRAIRLGGKLLEHIKECRVSVSYWDVDDKSFSDFNNAGLINNYLQYTDLYPENDDAKEAKATKDKETERPYWTLCVDC